MENLYTFQCPHCEAYIQVEKNQVNCGIFRHGYFYTRSETGEITLTHQVNPHESKEECDRLVLDGKVHGCCKPFRLTQKEDGCLVEICDYI